MLCVFGYIKQDENYVVYFLNIIIHPEGKYLSMLVESLWKTEYVCVLTG